MSFPAIEIPDYVEDPGGSLATRAGQIRSDAEKLAERLKDVADLATNPPKMDGAVDECFDRAAENLQRRKDTLEDEWKLRERIHELLEDLEAAVADALEDARADYEQAVQDRREQMDEAGIYPADAEEPQRARVFGKLLWNHPDVHNAWWGPEGVKGVKGRLDTVRQKRQRNEDAAKQTRSKLERCQSRLDGLEERRQQRKRKAEARQSESRRRQDRQARQEQRIQDSLHPFDTG